MTRSRHRHHAHARQWRGSWTDRFVVGGGVTLGGGEFAWDKEVPLPPRARKTVAWFMDRQVCGVSLRSHARWSRGRSSLCLWPCIFLLSCTGDGHHRQ
jgi:hypothetical protein